MKTPSLVGSSLLRAASEPAIYGVVLVAGLVVVIGNKTEASWDVLIKVLATLIVFWLAHVYAGVVAHLGDVVDDHMAPMSRLRTSVRQSLEHSWSMLLSGVIPLVVLTLGALKVLSDRDAIWGSLWAAVLVLGILGWLGVASWTSRPAERLVGALITSLLGVVLVALKALVH